jgi:exonuclease III
VENKRYWVIYQQVPINIWIQADLDIRYIYDPIGGKIERQSDYTEDHWRHLQAFSEQRGWSPPSSDAMNALDKLGYRDTFKEAGEGPLLTSWTDQPLFRIDYILISADCPLRTVRCRRDESTASDHFPVFADLAL